jgi:single-strand DNA-binding protein
MLNNVSLVGRLTKAPEVKIIGEGTPVCNFTLAVNRPYKDKDGENQADFIQCQAWKKQAEFIGTYIQKGQLVSITGSINTRTYEKDGVTHYVTEVNVNQVQSLERKDKAEIVTVGSIKNDWNAEWEKRSVGLDATSKSSLKTELGKKYQPLIDAQMKKDDLPF